MSRYRDDTQETAVASNSTWVRLTTITEEVATITSALLFGLLVLHTDAAVASDSVLDQVSHMVIERAVASDEVIDSLRSADLIVERATAADLTSSRLRVLHQEAAVASDAVVDQVRSMIVERAIATDTVLATRRVTTLVVETARAQDHAFRSITELVEESAAVTDWAGGKLHARVLVTETALAADALSDSQKGTALLIVERATASDAVLDRVHARDLVIELAIAEDQQLTGLDDAGQAWTANADTWAMSRYAPFTFDSLAVVDGVLYGFNRSGVYALEGSAETIAGSINTGKVDVGRGVLAHPQSAYMNYELDGTATLDVTTTQGGAAATYAYPLEPAPAESRTNGRFKLGLGLRGSHFAFVLRLTAKRGFINNLSVQSAPTNRRV